MHPEANLEIAVLRTSDPKTLKYPTPSKTLNAQAPKTLNPEALNL